MQSAPISFSSNAGTQQIDHSTQRDEHRRVIACIGAGENASDIMQLAAITANAFDSELTLLHVVDVDNLIGSPHDPIASELARREAAMKLSNLAEKWKSKTDNIKAVVLEGRAADQICIWARDHKVDMTIICAGDEYATSGWALGDTAQRVVECISGSVLIAPNREKRIENAAFKKILVLLDGSRRAESALPLALQIARSEKATLNLIHAVPEIQITEIGAPKTEDRLLRKTISDRNEKAAQTYFDQMRDRLYGSGVDVAATVLKDGDPRHMLVHAIDTAQADLVVLSSHGYSGHTDVAAGSVARHVITHTPIPLLLVRDTKQRPTYLNKAGKNDALRNNPFRHTV